MAALFAYRTNDIFVGHIYRTSYRQKDMYVCGHESFPLYLSVLIACMHVSICACNTLAPSWFSVSPGLPQTHKDVVAMHGAQ